MLIGHQKQWEFLKKSVELGKIPHGILFSGSSEIGKRTLAIEFIKLLNCSAENLPAQKTEKPCQICRSCKDIQKNSYPDLVLVEPVFPKKEIEISQIRKLIWKLSLRSYDSVFKAAIIDKAHLMNQEAQSCFLKLLEEPRGKTILILITEYPETLLPTIISRVQKLRFFSVPEPEIEKYLLSQNIAKEKAHKLALFSFGKPGRTIEFINKSQKLEEQKKIISDLIKLGGSELNFRFQYAKDFFSKEAEESNILGDILETWLSYFRNIFIDKIKNEGKPANQNYSLNPFGRYSLDKLSRIINLIQSTSFLLRTTNINNKLAFEILLMEI